MPTLQEILRDPNFVNANPATKQAIFDRWAPQDPNYSGANGATQQAIRERFGVGGGFAPAPEPKDETTGLLRRAADVPVLAAQGFATGFRLVADAFGADNAISKSIRGVEGYLGELASAQAQGNQKRMAEVLEEAKGKGVLDQLKIGLKAVSEAPLELISQAFGTVGATAVAGAAGKVLGTAAAVTRGAGAAQALQAGVRGQKIASGVTGVGMGLGVGKSSIYEAVTEELSKIPGMTPEQVEKAARDAQSYGGENLDQIALAGVLGGASALVGADPRLANLISNRILKKVGEKAAQEAGETAAKTPGLLSSTLRGAGAEFATEFPQGTQEQVAANIALQRQGFDVPTFDGAFASGIMEGVAGAGVGGGAGALSTPRAAPKQPEETPEVEIPEQPAAPIESVQVERFPLGTITEEDIDAAGVDFPRGFLPFVRRNILGKTRSELQAEVEANPELIEGEAPSARLIRSLLQPQPAADQSGVGVPVQQPAGGAPGIAAPQLGAVDGVGIEAQPPVVPQAPVTPTVTEIPSGITSPEAIEAEAQRPQAPRVPVPPRQVDRFGEVRPGPLEGEPDLSPEELAELGISTEPAAARTRRGPKKATIKPIENPENIGAVPDSVWQPGTPPETSLVTEGGKPFQSKTEAQEAKKLQPDMRLLKVPGGWVLTPKTEAQMEADRRAGERLGRARVGEAGRPQNAMQFIVDAGGLNRSAANNVPGVDPGRNLRVGNRFLVTPNGLSLEKAAELLQQNGYIDEVSESAAAEAMGNPNAYTPEGYNRIAELEAEEARREEDLARMDVEARTEEFEEMGIEDDAEDYLGSGYETATDKVKAEVDEILARADELGIDPEAIHEAARQKAIARATERGQPRVTDYDYYLSARQELQSVLQRSPEDRSQDTGKPGEAAPDLELTPPTPEAQAEAERRAEEAAKAEEEAAKEAEKTAEAERKERERREIEQRSAGAAEDFQLGQTAEENLTGQKDIFDTSVQISPEQQKQQAINLLGAYLSIQPPAFKSTGGSGRTVTIRPHPLTKKQIGLIKDLAGEAIDIGLPASTLDYVNAGGATSMNAVAAITHPTGWMLLGNQWASSTRLEQLSALIHEIGHGVDYDRSDSPKISGTKEWDAASQELKAWYDASTEKNKHPFAYPFAPQFKGKVALTEETFAQAFANYFRNPVELKANAPLAYAQIQSAVERIQNESQRTSRSSRATTGAPSVKVQPSRAEKGPTVQPEIGAVGTDIGRAKQVEDRGLGEVDQGPDPDIVSEMMESPNIETEPGKHKRENIFMDSVEATWQTPEDPRPAGISDYLIYQVQNKQIDLKRVQDAVSNLAYNNDAYLRETLYHGRVAKQIQKFQNKFLTKIVDAMQKNGITQEQIGEYLHNRHAPEANRHIAERNARFPDGGSGIDTQDAIDYMNNLDPQRKKQFEQVAKLIDDSIKDMQDMLVEYNVESPETIQNWRETFQNYIPLVREDADFSVNKVMSQGAGYSQSGKFSKARTGSTKEVKQGEILAAIAEQHERAILRAERTRVGQAMYSLAIQNPNPEFWLALDPETNVVWKQIGVIKELEQDRDLIQQVMDAGNVDKATAAALKMELDLIDRQIQKARKPALAAVEQAKEDLASMGLEPDLVDKIMMPPMKARYDAVKNEVVYEPNASFSNDHVFATRVNGKDKFILFNANNERSSRMVKALKNMDAENLSQAMNIAAKITRYFAAINTQYNPVFGAYNFLRDMQAGLLQVSDTPIADKRADILKNTAPAIKAIYIAIRGQRKQKDLSKVDNEMLKLWDEFTDRGGQTGFRDMFSQTSERADAIQKLIDPSSWAKSPMGKLFTAGGALKVPFETMRKGTGPLFDLLSDYNTTLENAVRLSAYKVAKQKFIAEGMPVEEAMDRAAAIGKELTVNFNRKGALSTQMGALYAFFNAAVQGTTRMAQTLRGPAGKTIIGGALLFGVLQAVMLAAAGFDDEEPPEFVKQRNYIIPLGDGKYFAFPMPLGFNVIPSISRIATEAVLSGGEDLSGKVVNLLDAVMDMYNPIGNAGMSMQTISPTLLDPAVALFENKDWTGKKISREDIDKSDPTPGFTRSKQSATALSNEVARYLNYASGGTDAKPGAVSPTADQIDYLIGQLTGGVGRESMKIMKTAEAQVTGEELPFYSVPLFGRFYGDVNEMAAVSNAFYRNVTDLNIHRRELELLRKEKGDVQEYLKDHPEARMSQMAKSQYREIQKLRKTRLELLSRDEKEKAKRLEEQIKIRMQRFNERYKDLKS